MLLCVEWYFHCCCMYGVVCWVVFSRLVLCIAWCCVLHVSLSVMHACEVVCFLVLCGVWCCMPMRLCAVCLGGCVPTRLFVAWCCVPRRLCVHGVACLGGCVLCVVCLRRLCVVWFCVPKRLCVAWCCAPTRLCVACCVPTTLCVAWC